MPNYATEFFNTRAYDETVTVAQQADSLLLSPTLIIGLGGTGKAAIYRLRQMFYERYGVVRFPMIAHLVIDSDTLDSTTDQSLGATSFGPLARPTDLATSGPAKEFLFTELGRQGYDKYFGNLEAFPNISSWLRPEMDEYGAGVMTNGNGTFRPFGRLSFFHNFNEIQATISALLQNVVSEAVRVGDGTTRWTPPTGLTPQLHNHLEIVLVHSLAGGTGAGMFIDVAYLVREIAEKEYGKNWNPHITDIAVLPGMLKNVLQDKPTLWARAQANAYACLREMEHYNMRRWERSGLSEDHVVGRALDNAFSATWSQLSDYGTIETRGAPWDTCYLLDNVSQMCADPLEPSQVFDLVAEYLMLDFEPTAFPVWKREMRTNHASLSFRHFAECVPDAARPVHKNAYSCRFSTFGLSKIFYDRARVRLAISYLMAIKLIANHRGAPLGAALDRDIVQWFRGTSGSQITPENIHTAESWHKDLCECYLRQLFKDMDGVSLLKKARAEYDHLGSTRQIAGYKKTKNETLEDLVTTLNSMQERRLSPDSRAGDLHSPLVVIRENATRLEQKLCDELDRRCTQCFGSHGTLPTIELLTRFGEQFVQIQREAEKIRDTTPADEAAVNARLHEVERLPNRPRHIKDSARGIVLEQTCDDAWEKYMEVKYRAMAADILDHVLASVAMHLKESLDNCQAGDSAFEKLEEEILETGFKSMTQEAKNVRNYVLWSPRDRDEYLSRLDGLLGRRAQRMAHHANQGKPEVDWNELERSVYRNITSDDEYTEFVDRVASGQRLIARSENDRFQPRSDGELHEFGDVMMRACLKLLHAEQDAFDATRYFTQKLDMDRQNNAMRLISQRSDVYLQRDSGSDAWVNTGTFRVLFLANQNGSEERKIRQRIGVDLNQAELGEPESILLYHEEIGFPTIVLSNLKNYARAYYNTQVVTIADLHINYHETKEHLPDIQSAIGDAGNDIFDQIRSHAGEVLFAMINGTIAFQESLFKLWMQGDKEWVRLASQYSRTVKLVAGTERYRTYIRRLKEQWFGAIQQRGPIEEARELTTTLLAFWELKRLCTPSILEAEGDRKISNPIYFAADQNEKELVDRLKVFREGRLYLDGYYTTDLNLEQEEKRDRIRKAKADCLGTMASDFRVPIRVKDKLVPALDDAQDGNGDAAGTTQPATPVPESESPTESSSAE